MSWETPEGFLWLLAAPLVFLLYMLRGRSQPKQTATAFLWDRALARRSTWQRIRPWVSAGWRALVVVLLVAALAAPMLGPREVKPRVFAIVLDATASMKATDVEESRFEAAKQSVATVIDSLGPADRCAVVVVGVEPGITLRATDDIALLRETIEAIEATDAAGDIVAGIRVADNMFRGVANAQVLAFTDAEVDSSVVKHAKLAVYAKALTAKNVGVVSIAARSAPIADKRSTAAEETPSANSSGASDVVARFQANTSTNNKLAIVWKLDGREVRRKSVDLRNGQGIAMERFEGPGLVTVQLEQKDHLAVDDRAAVRIGDQGLRQGISTATKVHFVSPESGTLTPPNGVVKDYTSLEPGPMLQVIGPFDQVGGWRWSPVAGEEQTCEVSLLSASESRLSSEVDSVETSIEPGQSPATRQQGWFFLFALLTWSAEWLAFIVGVTE